MWIKPGLPMVRWIIWRTLTLVMLIAGAQPARAGETYQLTPMSGLLADSAVAGTERNKIPLAANWNQEPRIALRSTLRPTSKNRPSRAQLR